MELSWEVKEYLAGVIAKESSGGIQIIGMRLGIDPNIIRQRLINPQFKGAISGVLHALTDTYTGMSPQENAAQYIVENTDNPDILIKTVFDANTSRDDEIYTELNSIMERTMQCRMDEKGNISPILDENLQILEKETFIEKKLEEFEFAKTLANYKSAIKIYKTDYKGAISLLRSTFESLVDEIIESEGETLKNNQKDKIAQLTNWEILKKIDRDNEVEHSYRIFGLLSHYGSHTELITEEEANFLFISTLAFIWFLIKRYENRKVK